MKQMKKKINNPFKLKQKHKVVSIWKPMKPNYKRTPIERKLIRKNPWGDRDRDLVPNWIDCKPLNKNKQGKSRLLIESIGQELWNRSPNKKLNPEAQRRYLQFKNSYYPNNKKNIAITEYKIAKYFAKHPEHLEKVRNVRVLPGPDIAFAQRFKVLGTHSGSGSIGSRYSRYYQHHPKKYTKTFIDEVIKEGEKSIIGITPHKRLDEETIHGLGRTILHELGHAEDNKKSKESKFIKNAPQKEEAAEDYRLLYEYESKKLKEPKTKTPHLISTLDLDKPYEPLDESSLEKEKTYNKDKYDYGDDEDDDDYEDDYDDETED